MLHRIISPPQELQQLMMQNLVWATGYHVVAAVIVAINARLL